MKKREKTIFRRIHLRSPAIVVRGPIYLWKLFGLPTWRSSRQQQCDSPCILVALSTGRISRLRRTQESAGSTLWPSRIHMKSNRIAVTKCSEETSDDESNPDHVYSVGKLDFIKRIINIYTNVNLVLNSVIYRKHLQPSLQFESCITPRLSKPSQKSGPQSEPNLMFTIFCAALKNRLLAGLGVVVVDIEGCSLSQLLSWWLTELFPVTMRCSLISLAAALRHLAQGKLLRSERIYGTERKP